MFNSGGDGGAGAPPRHSCSTPCCRQLSTKGLRTVAARCTNLQSLSLYGCTDVQDESFIPKLPPAPKTLAQCTGLTRLDLTGCIAITDAGVASAAQHCSQLLSLTISGCFRITDAGFAAAMSRCSTLQHLDASGCHGLAEAAPAALGLYCKRALDVSFAGCEALTPSGLAAMARGCTALTSLGLAGCMNGVTDEAVQAIAQGAGVGGPLRHLDLTGCELITDVGVGALAKHATGLTSLELAWCDRITDKGIGLLAERCTQLHTLRLAGCSRLRRLPLDLSRLPHLKGLWLSATTGLELPPHIDRLQNSAAGVTTWLADGARTGTKPAYLLKIVALGAAAAGKSSLLDALSAWSAHGGAAFPRQARPAGDRTRGVDVRWWTPVPPGHRGATGMGGRGRDSVREVMDASQGTSGRYRSSYPNSKHARAALRAAGHASGGAGAGAGAGAGVGGGRRVSDSTEGSAMLPEDEAAAFLMSQRSFFDVSGGVGGTRARSAAGAGEAKQSDQRRQRSGEVTNPISKVAAPLSTIVYDFAGQQTYAATHPLFMTSDALYMVVTRLDHLWVGRQVGDSDSDSDNDNALPVDDPHAGALAPGLSFDEYRARIMQERTQARSRQRAAGRRKRRNQRRKRRKARALRRLCEWLALLRAASPGARLVVVGTHADALPGGAAGGAAADSLGAAMTRAKDFIARGAGGAGLAGREPVANSGAGRRRASVTWQDAVNETAGTGDLYERVWGAEEGTRLGIPGVGSGKVW